MRAVVNTLSAIRADRGPAFWLWFSVKLALGLSQMAGAIVVLVLYLRQGLSSTMMGWFLFVAFLTTISLILFRVVRWKPVKR
jgi:hypothetical protein